MIDKISAFPGVVRPESPLGEQPCQEVIEFLEEILADARLGKIQAIGVAYVSPNNITSDGFASAKNTGHNLFAAIADLFYSASKARWERSTSRSDAGDGG
jgi:hypothetical protein